MSLNFTYLTLGSDCNLSKDLSKDKRDGQLVKYKDIELYLLLYILIDYEEREQCP